MYNTLSCVLESIYTKQKVQNKNLAPGFLVEKCHLGGGGGAGRGIRDQGFILWKQ